MAKVLLGTTALVSVVLAGAAQAADIPLRKAPAALAPAPFSWSGFYIGGHVGAGWGTKEWSDLVIDGDPITAAPFGNYNINGFLGGGQIGLNWQSGWTVFGVEADASWSDLHGGGGCFFAGKFSCRSKVEWFGTVTGRVGAAVDRALIYLKGGGAWAHEKHDIFFNGKGGGLIARLSDTRWGWTVGGGIEYAFAPAWSAKVEYNYLDFGKKGHGFSFDDGQTIVNFGMDVRQSIHAVKFGLNYRFTSGR
jgi:outer membrane immunogenic protein